MMTITLENIDIVRERAGVSYKEAKEALEATNNDVVEAIVLLEQRTGQSWITHAQIKGSELVDQIKLLVREGNVRRIRIRQDDKILLEFPVTAGAIGALLVPQIAAVGVLAALIARCTIEVEKDEGPAADQPIMPEADDESMQ